MHGDKINQINYVSCSFISLCFESPRREVYGEGLSLPMVGFLRKHREGVRPDFWDAWDAIRKCIGKQMLGLP